ncbi:unnamed protein product [Trichogramma brassicae]|uniref:Uncharacterized protein n=1 Tax=Trichogramma brassicae TaxID=86971 RepID=A0A6H5HW11_9HYME|nr:unnamed protein product [Trichogramma brassicae]
MTWNLDNRSLPRVLFCCWLSVTFGGIAASERKKEKDSPKLASFCLGGICEAASAATDPVLASATSCGPFHNTQNHWTYSGQANPGQRQALPHTDDEDECICTHGWPMRRSSKLNTRILRSIPVHELELPLCMIQEESLRTLQQCERCGLQQYRRTAAATRPLERQPRLSTDQSQVRTYLHDSLRESMCLGERRRAIRTRCSTLRIAQALAGPASLISARSFEAKEKKSIVFSWTPWIGAHPQPPPPPPRCVVRFILGCLGGYKNEPSLDAKPASHCCVASTAVHRALKSHISSPELIRISFTDTKADFDAKLQRRVGPDAFPPSSASSDARTTLVEKFLEAVGQAPDCPPPRESIDLPLILAMRLGKRRVAELLLRKRGGSETWPTGQASRLCTSSVRGNDPELVESFFEICDENRRPFKNQKTHFLLGVSKVLMKPPPPMNNASEPVK